MSGVRSGLVGRRRAALGLGLPALALACCASPASAQTFVDWLNERLDVLVAARLAQDSGAREVEAPSITESSTALVNQSGASDLVGLALNGSPLSRRGPDDPETSSMVVSLTPYAILSAILGIDPDDPFHYEARRAWRIVSLTLGTEDAEVAADGAQVRATLIGLKLELWSRRTPDPSSAAVQNLRSSLGLAAATAGPLSAALVDSLHAWTGAFAGFPRTADPATADANRVGFVNEVLRDPGRFPGILRFIRDEQADVLLGMIEDEIDPFLENRRAANDVLAEIRGAPQLALDVQSRIRESGDDDVRIGLALDLGLADQWHWVTNAGATFVSGDGDAGVASGVTVASGFTFDLRTPRLGGPDPFSLEAAFEGEFLEERDPTWRVQGKLTLPVLPGLNLPISVTWANRTDLIDEEAVVGRVGFTVDSARLLRGLGGK